jgi:uncharacterized repeat protein (TIGR01451 family)
MSASVRPILMVLLILYSALSFAQLTITSPVPRIVYQRNQADEATIAITGLAPPTATTVEARFMPMAVGQGEVTAWTSLSFLPSSKAFRGSVLVKKGQYRLDVRAKTDSTLVAETHVNRVGVGEVFVLAGQSNVYGGLQRVPSSEEDRVSCVDFRQETISEYLLPFRFSNVSYGSNIGPSQPPHLWSILGDRLVRRLNVPVMFLGAALGGTSSDEWKQSASGNLGNTPNSSVYRRLGIALLHYVSRTGARAVLWHQGENDLMTSTQTYFDNIQYVINKSRQQTGFNQLAWMVSRTSFVAGQTSSTVIAAQNQLIDQVHDVFAGPATDSIIGPENRPDGTHMLGEGLYRFINTWEQCLNSTFFNTSIPFTPVDSSAFITSGYTLPLTRRPGETIQVASLRADAHEADNQYVAQLVRADNNQLVYESAPGTANPLMVTLPANLPDGQYRMRTNSTHPVTLGTLGEPFQVQQSATPTATQPSIQLTTSGGTTDPAILRFAYRYEPKSHGFFVMVRSDVPVETRVESMDGGSFGNSGWNLALPSSQGPDYAEFADFNYLNNYPPSAFGVGGVEPGRYRLSVRRQGDSGSGLWYDVSLIEGRNILYYAMEPIPPVPPILTLYGIPATPPCVSGSFSVSVTVTDGEMNNGNNFMVQLSDATGSFNAGTTIGTGSTSPILATLPSGLPSGNNYRIRVIGSNPATASIPGPPLLICPDVADLSLSMQFDNRAPAVGQVVSLTLSLTNSGPQAAAGVRLQSLLPPAITFVDSPNTAISMLDSAVTIEAGTVSAGTTIPYIFRLKATQSGTFATAAQIINSQTFDPDSQPNSGTGDGQDDASLVDLRTADATGPLVTSPNPNQTPLPAVLSNQPSTDSTKADLSLSMSTSNLTVSANGLVSLTITIFNRGGLVASNTAIQVILPTGWQVTDTTDLTVNDQTITASIAEIAAGNSVSFVLPIQVSGTGTITAQILSVAEADPDSTPGNGFENGEDDEARIRIRTNN